MKLGKDLHGYATDTVVTPCGWAYLAVSVAGVAACIWPLADDGLAALKDSRPEDETTVENSAHLKLKQAVDALLAYFSGDFKPLENVEIDSRNLSLWQRMVYYPVRSIPPGEVRPYKWVADQCGKPGGARVVGQALSVNPTPLFVPCHRVVHSDGRTGNFTSIGRIPGPILKKLLLQWERGDQSALDEMSRLFREEG